MKTINLSSVILTIALFGCGEPHETSKISGKWTGHQVYEFEQTIMADSAQTLEELLGEVVRGTEIVQDSLEFQIREDSAWIRSDNFEGAFWLIPDEENKKDFLLVGDPTLSLRVSKLSGDSLIIDEQITPVTFSLNSSGQIETTDKKILKSRFVLKKTTDQDDQ